ncbi:septal ring lytic transglycosylase RlpA family protein [Erythrobacter insulae]|uniref:Endolytic peptidoglycan transglycosylase RlpA n=1 Tax=Erythrobacter insulae TaxID=2584124 RepID=A0A547PE10_9SPHN|nr:septal ring lytic transglycosylase RlpA family protein [Erythrobacter insulae]TRD12359.1 septal ring lytic transglycosylase RlpA family protein [Erythrobacter insulae]
MGVGKRSVRVKHLAPFAALLCASTGLSAQDDADASGSDRTPMSASYPQPEPPFSDVFEPFSTSRPDLNVPSSAVDLDAFEPPLEPEESTRNLGTGVASYYGRRFHGRLTANGERFNMNAMTAAHKTLPFGTKVRVINARNGRSVVVRINDRGPFIRGRTIDLSRGAARKLGMISRGHASVKMEIIE